MPSLFSSRSSKEKEERKQHEKEEKEKEKEEKKREREEKEKEKDDKKREKDEKKQKDKEEKRKEKQEKKKGKDKENDIQVVVRKADTQSSLGSIASEDSKIIRSSVPRKPGSDTCAGCGRVERLFQRWDPESRGPGTHQYVKFHDSFAELDDCSERCGSCRVFRQALLMRQTTAEDEAELRASPDKMIAALVRGDEPAPFAQWTNVMLRVSCGTSTRYSRSAHVSCTKSEEVDYVAPARTAAGSHERVSEWLAHCRKNHPECGSLHYSTKNPTRLVEIQSESRSRLIEKTSVSTDLRYVTISYCWGPNSNTDPLIKRGNTLRDNYEARKGPEGFPNSELPKTLEQAIIFTYKLGIRYIWIDSVCIIQDDPKDKSSELPKMHRVYGNAIFTLCIGSNAAATESLFRARDAWRWRAPRVKLSNYNLVNFDASLDEAREHSPLAGRGWTLQEEFLSPRRLYWFAHSLYWSCARVSWAEDVSGPGAEQRKLRRPVRSPAQMRDVPRHPQHFLLAGWERDRELLHDQWLGIVESYTTRSLREQSDRFDALAGVAARYLDYVAGERDEYMAGLWRNTFAQELAWAVNKGADAEGTLRAVAPSWSWASVPFGTRIAFRRKMKPAAAFELVATPQHKTPAGVVKAIKSGQTVREVVLRGRLRPLWPADCKVAAWDDVHDPEAADGSFSFRKFPGENVRAANPQDGRLVVAEARRKPVACQLDYAQDALRVAGTGDDGGSNVEVLCLELGEAEMLLLERDEASDTHRRIGISMDGSPSFFNSAETADIRCV